MSADAFEMQEIRLYISLCSCYRLTAGYMSNDLKQRCKAFNFVVDCRYLNTRIGSGIYTLI